MDHRAKQTGEDEILALGKELIRKPGAITEAILGIIVMSILFLSGFLALGTYVIGTQKQDFLSRAIEVEAKVTDASEKQRIESNRLNNQRSSKTYYDTILTFEFQGPSETVVARLNDGSSSVYKKGDVTTILYDPANPKKIQLPEKSDALNIFRLVSQISTSVFLVTLMIVSLATMWRRRQR